MRRNSGRSEQLEIHSSRPSTSSWHLMVTLMFPPFLSGPPLGSRSHCRFLSHRSCDATQANWTTLPRFSPPATAARNKVPQQSRSQYKPFFGFLRCSEFTYQEILKYCSRFDLLTYMHVLDVCHLFPAWLPRNS